ncbi:MAG: ABC transporter ATP-binding protein, partial [Peptostreptococcaceae bacterium]
SKEFNMDKKGVVEFKNVSFRYPDAEEDILTNISFTAKSGQTTAFIGSTGSGKSTLINLIPRFFDVTQGEILVDGVNIKDVSQYDLREKIGYVPQKGMLFSGTIDSNLRYGKKDATEEDINKASRIAQATEFIDSKPERYESEISQGGTNVSGGQKQRLSIARAIAKNPEIYIFDDSFSALDFKTDSKLRKALKEEISESTVLIVAQRISTILNAEQIIVLDEGNIVGKGTHKELLNNCEVYNQIALSQLSKEELADE